MNNFFALDPQVFQWVVLPLLIFFARVCDVSLGTARIILVSKGHRYLAPLIGFAEIIIWLLAIRQIFLNLTNVACLIGFAAGFSLGNYAGILIEEKLAIGVQVIRVITRKDAASLVSFLSEKGYGVTSVDGQGTTGKVNIIYTIVKRSEIPKALDIIKQFNPKAFYTIEDIRSVSEIYSPPVASLNRV
jgi:uncharacterized protein YebE (UPF0316 family)